MMRVMVTGASGMVGRNLCDHLDPEFFTVFRPSSAELDLLDQRSVTSYVGHIKPDLVIHCAGKVGGIQANIADPVSFLVDNMRMGLNIVQASLDAGVKSLINLGSSCMYPRNASNPLKESQVLQGELEPTNEGYALAKISVARLCEYISTNHDGFNYKTIIPCNLYGYYDKFDPKNSHMIPAVLAKIHYAKMNSISDVEVWGTGEVRREFMFSEDLAKFIVWSLDKLDQFPNLLNLGPGIDFSINEYYQAAANAVGYTGSFVHDLSKPEGMKQKLVDNSLVKELGWASFTSLEDGLGKTYKFYVENVTDV